MAREVRGLSDLPVGSWGLNPPSNSPAGGFCNPVRFFGAVLVCFTSCGHRVQELQKLDSEPFWNPGRAASDPELLPSQQGPPDPPCRDKPPERCECDRCLRTTD